MCGENTSTVQSIGRDEQDEYAILSYTRSQEAAARGAFKDEIVPITVKSKKSCELQYILCYLWTLSSLEVVSSSMRLGVMRSSDL